MLPAPIAYEAPATLAEAVAILGADRSAVVLGASPRTVIDLKMRRTSPGRLVDLRRIAELRGIGRDGDGRRLGSMTTLREITDDGAIRAGYAGLARAAELAGDPQMRNMETLLGCLTQDLATSGVAAALLALDATVELVGSKGVRTTSVRDLIADATSREAGHGELVVAVILPPVDGASAYEQVGHPATLDPICGVAVSVTVDADGRVGRCAFAVAGATPRPIRLGPAETAIIGQPLTDDAIRAASAVAADGLELVSDAFASGEYRGHLIAALLRRALAAIAGAGSGSQAPR